MPPAVFSALGALLTLTDVGAFVPSVAPLGTAWNVVRGSCTRALATLEGNGMDNLEGGHTLAGGMDGKGQISRQGWLQTATAVAAAAAGLASSQAVPGGLTARPPAAVAADDPPQGLPASGFFVQHAVFNVADMEAEVRFFTEGLGMRVTRQREVAGARNVFVAYGPESLKAKDGGYFSLELVYDPKARSGYPSGGAFEYLGITLPTKLATVAYNTNEAGGEMIPHWFGTTDYVEVTSPAGITIRAREGKRRDPMAVVAFGTADEPKARAYVRDVLGMKEQDTGLLKILGPLVGEANNLFGYEREGVSIALNAAEGSVQKGGRFDKLAVLTRDTKALADRVSGTRGAKQGGGDVLFAGEVPGIGTKVANTVDFEGRGIVYVDYEDFEKEMAQ